MGREQSKSALNAREYLKSHPETSAKMLAFKFEIDVSTVYRSKWWQERKERVKNGGLSVRGDL